MRTIELEVNPLEVYGDLMTDNGHTYIAHTDTGLLTWIVPDVAPEWGADLKVLSTGYRDWDSRAILTSPKLTWDRNPNGSEDLTTDPLTLQSGLPRLSVENQYFIANRKRWNWAMMTGFLDYFLFLNEQDITPLLQQAMELGSKGRRVLGMAFNLAKFYPSNYGDDYFGRIPEFLQLLSHYGQYAEWVALADCQHILEIQHTSNQVKFTEHLYDVLRPITNVVVELVNEWPKNGVVPTEGVFHKPDGIVWSRGSSLSDTHPAAIASGSFRDPNKPHGDYATFHPRREPRVKRYTCLEDMNFIQIGKDGNGTDTGFGRVATVANEPVGFASFVSGSRENNPEVAEALAYSSMGFGRGLTIHTEHGLRSQLLDNVEQEASRRAFAILADRT